MILISPAMISRTRLQINTELFANPSNIVNNLFFKLSVSFHSFQPLLRSQPQSSIPTSILHTPQQPPFPSSYTASSFVITKRDPSEDCTCKLYPTSFIVFRPSAYFKQSKTQREPDFSNPAMMQNNHTDVKSHQVASEPLGGKILSRHYPL